MNRYIGDTITFELEEETERHSRPPTPPWSEEFAHAEAFRKDLRRYTLKSGDLTWVTEDDVEIVGQVSGTGKPPNRRDQQP